MKRRLLNLLSPRRLADRWGYARARLMPAALVSSAGAAIRYDAGLGAGREFLCVFSAFSHGGRVGDYAWRYLTALRKAGLDIAYVSASPLAASDVSRLSSLCRLVVEKPNRCQDFSAWRIGLELTANARGYTSVLLANDSVFGPFSDFGKIVDIMRGRGAPLWGMTESKEQHRHLQSYFIWAERPVLDSPAWRAFWEGIRWENNRRWICGRYEIGFSQAMAAAGFEFVAWPPTEAALADEDALPGCPNVSMACALPLVERFKFPFLKRSLFSEDFRRFLRQYPDRPSAERYRRSLSRWREVLAAHTDYPPELVETEVSRMPGGSVRFGEGVEEPRHSQR